MSTDASSGKPVINTGPSVWVPLCWEFWLCTSWLMPSSRCYGVWHFSLSAQGLLPSKTAHPCQSRATPIHSSRSGYTGQWCLKSIQGRWTISEILPVPGWSIPFREVKMTFCVTGQMCPTHIEPVNLFFRVLVIVTSRVWQGRNRLSIGMGTPRAAWQVVASWSKSPGAASPSSPMKVVWAVAHWLL